MNIESSAVLITGGAGFIGSNVATKFLNQDAYVHIIDNYFAGKASLVPSNAEIHDIDIRDAGLKSLMSDIDPDILVHLAAIHYIPYCNEHPEEAFDVNVIGTRNVLNAARKVENLQKTIFASSAAVYPPLSEPHSEDSTLGPTDIYGKTKLIGEDLMEMFSRETGTSTTSARLFNVYGPNETNSHLIPAILEQIQAGSRTIELGNLSPQRDFIHVSDVSRAILSMASNTNENYRVYNVGTGTEYSVEDVVVSTSEALGEDIDIKQDPERVRESDRPHLKADITRIENELNWTPTVSFVDGLRKLLEQEVKA
jgi:UDP-glucose 4-epimerase